MPERYTRKGLMLAQLARGELPSAPVTQAKGKHGTAAEKKFAKRTGARLTSGSGNKADKGDAVLYNFRLELKATVKASISLKLDWLLKIKEQAMQRGQKPAVALQFVDEHGELIHNGSWVAIQESDYLRVIEILEAHAED